MDDQTVPNPPSSSEIGIDEAMRLAGECQIADDLDTAAEVYRRILAAVPGHPGALHYLGLVHYRRSEIPAAITLMEEAIARAPEVAEFRNNLGNVYFGLDRFDKAAEHYEAALALAPDNVDVLNNLGILARLDERNDKAEDYYRRAVALAPDHSVANHNLGKLLAETRRFEEAHDFLMKAIAADPVFSKASRILLARALCATGQLDRAKLIFEDWLSNEPGDPRATHLLAALQGGPDTPSRASDAYVEREFDVFAASFDVKLEQLGYKAPALVAEALAGRIGGEPEARFAVLDAGCGTGLCGPLLKPHAAELVGVDLSREMLARADERGGYDRLLKAELTAFLAACSNRFDIIVSADTLVYFGALEEVLRSAFGALRPGGHLVFTVERMTDDQDGRGFGIQQHGRYWHARSYIERCLADAGFRDAELGEAVLRHEGGRPVNGYVVAASRPA